ncbi:MAG: HAMP domain-containing sensor histidine kinase [Rhodoferax sp.]|nr:HAMP domain-containing sensor histidine kinase [Rhodoferax sp.]
MLQRFFDLSLRYKIPIWGSFLIVVTTLLVSLSLVYKAYDDLRENLLAGSASLAHRLADDLFHPLMEDDLWRAFGIINAPLVASDAKDVQKPRFILVLDNELKVVTSTDPMLIPMGTQVSQLTPEYSMFVQRIAESKSLTHPTYDMQDEKNFYIAAPIVHDGFTLGTLIVVHSKDEILWPKFFRILIHGATMGVIALAILLPINWYWARRTVRPLVLISQRMKENDLNAATEVVDQLYPYHDELGELFQAYKRMLVEQKGQEALERQVVQSERLAAVGHLAAGVAHEINNPLGGMLTAIDTLNAYGNMDARTAKTVALIQRGLKQIKETVGALLVEARVRNRDLEPQDFEDVRSLILPQAQKKELQLQWQSNLARAVPLQANQVRQVLINLLLNAIHAANSRGVVDCLVEDHDSTLLLAVENDGKGFSPEQRAHLFEPFSPLSQSGQGHGLGLWVTYQIVQQLGGKIDLTQQNGRVRFAVTLPLLKHNQA